MVGDLMHLVDVVLSQGRDVLRDLGVGGDKGGSLHGLDPLQRVQIGGHIVEKADLVLVQRLAAGQTVRQIHHVVRAAEAHHVEEMAG